MLSIESDVSITKEIFFAKQLYILREDLLNSPSYTLKLRKFRWLIKKKAGDHRKLISWGGNQSNAMYVLSLICREKNWEFTYYTTPLPTWLKSNPQNNLKQSLNNGMVICETPKSDWQSTIAAIQKNKTADNSTVNSKNNSEIIVPQGGACIEAEQGLISLADQISIFIKKSNLKPKETLNIIVASGTGTTALYLQKNLPQCLIHAVCLVGEDYYLEDQMTMLENNKNIHPNILSSKEKHYFGKPTQNTWNMYQYWKQKNIEFDLLYDCSAWAIFKEHLLRFIDKPVLFLHTGGNHGNSAMISRYRRANLL